MTTGSTDTDPIFLTLDEILALHHDQFRRYGGTPGVRDRGLLSSALGTVSATYGGEFLHQGLHEMAAAYLYHIAGNHPFVDGNKRTALAAALLFLWMNDIEVAAKEEELTDLVMGVAQGSISKIEVALFFKDHRRQD